MGRQSIYHYDDDKLTGLAIAEMIAQEWAKGSYCNIAEVTSAIHEKCADLPRSAIFWLAYHTLTEPDKGATGGCASD